MEHGDFAWLGDGMYGVQPKPVEAIFVQPVQRILDGVRADFRYAVIDRAAPWSLRFGKEIRSVAGQIVSLGSEVIVDDVEEHHQSSQMRLIDQGLEIVGPAINAVGCVPQDAIVSPIARACEI